uniref:Uncharacterized protein n=1 Tax=Anguilla anguilla TaxID=7936 RepID=A0A0E9RXJ2_ANGAN
MQGHHPWVVGRRGQNVRVLPSVSSTHELSPADFTNLILPPG